MTILVISQKVPSPQVKLFTKCVNVRTVIKGKAGALNQQKQIRRSFDLVEVQVPSKSPELGAVSVSCSLTGGRKVPMLQLFRPLITLFITLSVIGRYLYILSSIHNHPVPFTLLCSQQQSQVLFPGESTFPLH